MYPTKEQEIQLKKTAGTARYAYNWALQRWKEMYALYKEDNTKEKPSALKLVRIWTKEKPEWAKEIAFCSQQHAIHNLGIAYSNFWRNIGKYPTFHKKGDKESFYIDNAKARWYGNRVNLPNIGRVKVAEQLRYSGKIISYTVSTYAGEWYISVNVETEEDMRPRCVAPNSTVGIDVGLQHPAVASDGTVLQLPTERLDKLEQKIKRYQKALARSKRNSKRSYKTLIKKQKTQQKINNIRKDAVHKFTTTVSKNHGTIVIEDLDIQEMRAKAPAKAVRRAFNSSVMTLVRYQLSYKCQRLVKANRYYASSKLCSKCGHKKEDLKITDRVYTCEACGMSLDRDLNAALNLMHYENSIRPGADSPVVLTEKTASSLR